MSKTTWMGVAITLLILIAAGNLRREGSGFSIETMNRLGTQVSLAGWGLVVSAGETVEDTVLETRTVIAETGDRRTRAGAITLLYVITLFAVVWIKGSACPVRHLARRGRSVEEIARSTRLAQDAVRALLESENGFPRRSYGGRTFRPARFSAWPKLRLRSPSDGENIEVSVG